MQNTTSARPTGVTIIAVLSIIGGVLGIFGALVILGIGGLAATVDGGIGGLAIILGLLVLIRAVAYLVFGIGAWQLKPWAWTIGMIVAAASIVLSILSILTGNSTIAGEIISIAIAAIILYYLYTPGVKAAFGKA